MQNATDMRHIFIVNPVAGAENCLFEIAVFVDLLLEEGFDARIMTTHKPGQAEEYAREIANDAARADWPARIYACGGDGTLNGVLNGVMTSQGRDFVEIAHVPRGSGNDFVKSFGQPEFFLGLEEFVTDAKVEKIDVIQVNERYCINICSLGFDARIAADATKNRFWSKKASYDFSVATNLFKGLTQEQEVIIQDIDGSELFIGEPLTMTCICNGSWYGGSYNPMPTANTRDGILDVLIVKKVGFLKALTLIKAYKNGKYSEHPDSIKHYQTRELTIKTATESPINIDGEIINASQADIKIIPKAISFFAPREAW